MADTRAATGLTVQQWDEQFFAEYFQENVFSDIYGTDEAAVIQVKENLTKKKGDSVTFALLNRLTNAATTGNAVLEGNEEDMISRSHKVTVPSAATPCGSRSRTTSSPRSACARR
jgi:hypothetical protein